MDPLSAVLALLIVVGLLAGAALGRSPSSPQDRSQAQGSWTESGEWALDATPLGPTGVHGLSVDDDPFSLPFIRARLAALAVELRRLDADPDIFAKAFHMHAAREAQQLLLAEAAQFGGVAGLDGGGNGPWVPGGRSSRVGGGSSWEELAL